MNWLKAYVPGLSASGKDFGDRMTLVGNKVETMEDLGENLEKIVTGKILSVKKHEDSDHLLICQVDIGKETLQIVTGAPNVKEGQVVPVVLDGGKVKVDHEGKRPEGGVSIHNGKLRGVESFGMMCSIEELGGDRNFFPEAPERGIYIFPEGTTVGEDAPALLGFRDILHEYEITSNRVDCFSVVGLAREAAAAFGQEFHFPEIKKVGNEEKLSDYLTVELKDSELCSRYTARLIKNVRFAPSPSWMQIRLRTAGIRPINNFVDITNYVMLELGQPMHAFDRRDLAGDRIVVRTAKEGEKLVTLDEQELTLSESNLLICDGEKPVGLAGIMGGLNSEIKDTTTAVVFEAAKFARDNIRRSARALGKRTDASAHFEKGTDEYTVVLAMKRALHLTEELGAGTVTDECAGKNTGNSIEKRPLTVSLARVNGVLGIEVPGEAVCRILANLEMEPKLEGDALSLKIPAYREDMESYQDVAEEVIRFYGYEHIVPSFLKSAEVTSGGLNERQRRELKLKETLTGGGMYEAVHYSFFSPADLKLFRYPEGSEALRAIRILNPISEELSLMRTVLSPSMANAVMRNQKAGNLSGRLFELAKVFIPKSLPLTEYPEERAHLAFAFFGKEESFFTLKGALDLAAESLHVKFRYEASSEPFTHPYQTAAVYVGDVKVGYLGKLAYDIAGELNLRTDAYLAELDLDTIESLPHEPVCFTPLPKFPEVQRDLALVMDKAISCEQVVNLIQSCSPLIREVKLFDVYEGAPIPPTKKSLAFTLTFRPEEQAFTPEELDKLTQEILEKLKTSCDIALRV